MLLALFLTSIRIILVPFIIYFLFENKLIETHLISVILACFFYTIASVSDYFDGYFARKFNATSKLGEFADPLADKFLTIGLFITFYFVERLTLPLWTIPLIILIIIRELGITAIRIFAIHNNTTMKTERHGKIKTTIQITSQSIILIIILIYSFFQHFYNTMPTGTIAFILNILPATVIIISAIITVQSGVSYLIVNKNIFKRIAQIEKN